MDPVLIVLMVCALVAFTFVVDGVLLILVLFMEEKGGCLARIKSAGKKDFRLPIHRAMVIFGILLVFSLIVIFLYCHQSLP